MGFDDYYEHKSKYRRYNQYHEHEDHSMNEYSPMYRGGRGHENYGFYIVNKIWNNRKLRLLLLVAALIILIVVILLLIAIFPLLIRIFDYVAQTGLKGITETVTGFIDKLWSGSGN
jgi:uncharacterized membrane protein